MKICVLGTGLLAKEFKNLEYIVIDEDVSKFKIEHILDYDVIINTYDYICEDDGKIDLAKMRNCNIDLPFLLSEYCHSRHKKYVHFSTADLYAFNSDICNESTDICASSPYTATKLLGESGCTKDDLILRTRNIFNHESSNDNALFNAIINSTPTKNSESYAWTVDVIRATIALLRNKAKGVFNLASTGLTSQAEICKALGILDIAPITDDDEIKYISIGLNKLMEHIIPMDVMTNIPKCFNELKDDLKGD